MGGVCMECSLEGGAAAGWPSRGSTPVRGAGTAGCARTPPARAASAIASSADAARRSPRRARSPARSRARPSGRARTRGGTAGRGSGSRDGCRSLGEQRLLGDAEDGAADVGPVPGYRRTSRTEQKKPKQVQLAWAFLFSMDGKLTE